MDKYEKLIEWSATFLLILCVIFSSLNWYPANIITGLFGNVGFMLMGLAWRKWSLAILSFVLGSMYMGGVIYYLVR